MHVSFGSFILFVRRERSIFAFLFKVKVDISSFEFFLSSFELSRYLTMPTKITGGLVFN